MTLRYTKKSGTVSENGRRTAKTLNLATLEFFGPGFIHTHTLFTWLVISVPSWMRYGPGRRPLPLKVTAFAPVSPAGKMLFSVYFLVFVWCTDGARINTNSEQSCDGVLQFFHAKNITYKPAQTSQKGIFDQPNFRPLFCNYYYVTCLLLCVGLLYRVQCVIGWACNVANSQLNQTKHTGFSTEIWTPCNSVIFESSDWLNHSN